MSREPRVSVQMPVYNGERTLSRAVESVLAQDFTDFELLILDDGSTDRTAAVAEGFRDPRVRVLRNERNQGISRSRNELLRASRGDLLAILDADDVALPGRFARQVKALDADSGLDGVFGWMEAFREDPAVVVATFRPVIPRGSVRSSILFENPFVHSAGMVRRQAMGRGYREDLSCAEDYAKWLELVFAGKRLALLPDPVVRGWSHAPTSYTLGRMRENVMALHAERLAAVLGRSLSPEEREAHWDLYEFSAWVPSSSGEARDRLARATSWVRELERAPLHDPEIDRAAFAAAAKARLHLLCGQALPVLGLGVLRFGLAAGPLATLKLAAGITSSR